MCQGVRGVLRCVPGRVGVLLCARACGNAAACARACGSAAVCQGVWECFFRPSLCSNRSNPPLRSMNSAQPRLQEVTASAVPQQRHHRVRSILGMPSRLVLSWVN